MLERVTGKLLQRVLSLFFEETDNNNTNPNNDVANLWSGLVRYQNLVLHKDKINAFLIKQPLELVHGSIRSLQVRFPWGSSNASEPLVIVLDGLLLLFKTNYDDYHDAALQQQYIQQRQASLQTAQEQVAGLLASSSAFKQYLQTQLQQGLLPALAERVELHLRNVHIRLESDTDFCLGTVLESLHVQKQDHHHPPDALIHKLAVCNHFAVYCNDLSQTSTETTAWHRAHDSKHMVQALDATIARRLTLAKGTSPSHTYLLLPLDATLTATFAPPQQQPQHPAVQIAIQIPFGAIQFRNVQYIRLVHLLRRMAEFQYHLPLRYLRPSVSVAHNPRAWWQYALQRMQHEFQNRIRWSWHRFSQRLQQKRRYCELYQRKLLAQQQDEEGGEDEALSPREAVELQRLEDGLEGDLSIQDILLYRLLVHQRLGVPPPSTLLASKQRFGSRLWKRWVSDHENDSDDIQKLLEYWQDWAERQSSSKSMPTSSSSSLSWVAVHVELQVESGQLSLFAPFDVLSHADPTHRLQQRFLEFDFTIFQVAVDVMRDLESVNVELSLQDFVTSETRSDQKSYNVIQREKDAPLVGSSPMVGSPRTKPASREDAEKLPLVTLLLTKNPPSSNDFDLGLQVRVRALQLLLVPECEWILKVKTLLKPMPQYQTVSKFWEELSMAQVNSWASNRLGMLAKASTANAKHNSIDLDVDIDCPIIRISDGQGEMLQLDLGHARLRTEKLAGVADAWMISSGVALPLLGPPSASENGMDDVSILTPPRLRHTPMRYGVSNHNAQLSPRSGDPNVTGGFWGASGASVNMGNTIRLVDSKDEAFHDFLGADGDDSFAGDADTYFYDVFELRLEPGALTLKNDDKDKSREVIAPMDMRALIYKSVLPSDHTLCQMRLRCTLAEISVSISEDIVVNLASLLSRWSAILSSDAPLLVYSQVRVPQVPRRLLELTNENGINETDTSDNGSAFDELEFFDALESGPQESENGTTLLEDHWITETESLVDSESQSTPSRTTRRRRRRQRSMSDVSSISEMSTGKRRPQFNENFYLSAENLARLEEEAGLEESVAGDGSSHGDSFHSAVTRADLELVGNELDQGIVDLRSRILVLKQKIVELRQTKDNGSVASGATGKDPVKRDLRLQLMRSEAELKSLQAAQTDLSAKSRLMGNDDASRASGVRRLALRSATRASALLQQRKDRLGGDAVLDTQHNLTVNLKRDLLHFSFMVHQVQLRLQAHHGPSTKDLSVAQHFLLSFSQAGAVVRRAVGETRYYASVDSFDAHFQQLLSGEMRNSCLIIGGSNYAMASSMLPSRLPQFISPASMEEKLLRGSLQIRRQVSAHSRSSMKMVKARVVVGDLELRPQVAALQSLTATSNRLKSGVNGHSTRSNARGNGMMVVKDVPRGETYCVDVGLRASALRLVLRNNDVVGAVALTEFDSHLVQIRSEQLYRDRIHVDARVANLQVLGVADYELGMGSEIFGKRDVYNPIVRLRSRLQLVPRDEVSGWVTGMPASFDTWAVSDGRTWNAHSDLKIDSLSLAIVPSSTSKIEASIRSLQLAITSSNNEFADVVRSNHRKSMNGPAGLPSVRWRLDVSLKKSSATLQTCIDTTDSIDMARPKVIITFASSLSLQPSSSPDDSSAVIRVKVAELGVVAFPGNQSLVEPMVVSIELEAPLKMPFGKVSRNPQLALTDETMWAEHTVEPEDRSVLRDDIHSVLLVVKLSPIALNLTGTAVGSCLQLCDLAIESHRAITNLNVPSQTTGRVLDPDDSSMDMRVDDRVNGEAKRNGLIARLSFEGLFVLLQREAVVSGHDPDRLVALDVRRGRLSFSRTDLRTSLSAGVGFVSLIDYTFRAGVRMISGGILDAPCWDNKNDDSLSGGDLLSLYSGNGNTSGKISTDIDLRVGRINFLPLPSCLRGILSFGEILRGSLKPMTMGDSAPALPRSQGRFPSILRKLGGVSVRVQSDVLECILSSKDVPMFLRDGHAESIGVVAFRMTVSAEGFVRPLALGNGSLTDVISTLESTKVSEVVALTSFIEKRAASLSTLLSSNINFRVSDFQVLRTAILRSDNAPVCFEISAPAAGEQRITNSLSAFVTHSASVFASVDKGQDHSLSACHAVRLETSYVDVLVYIAKSSGGMSEAMNTTVRPIVELLKPNPSHQKSETGVVPLSSERDKRSDVAGLLASAPFFCSLKSEGIKITCVPGGATRLTESPIVKVALMDVTCGFGACLVPSDWKLIPEAALEKMTAVASLSVKHVRLGAWLKCEVSASYHNRRLVAWEPFVEPWMVEVLVGLDMTRTMGLHPVIDNETQEGHRAETPDIRQTRSSLDIGSTRLRDIGRLLRSPFQGDQLPRKDDVELVNRLGDSKSDFCFLVLSLAAQDLLAIATCPRKSSTQLFSSSVLPGYQPVDWLSRFGYPMEGDVRDLSSPANHPAIMCRVSDTYPLNINVTGSFIENLGDLVSREDESRRLAPHLIRNYSGLTVRFQEVLDSERQGRGERPTKVTLANGTEAPLSLKRSVSQSCDPHRASITMELGSFEDTVGRLQSSSLGSVKGSRSTAFAYRVAARIRVDTVGISTFPLEEIVDKRLSQGSLLEGERVRTTGWVIVRVRLREGIKIVSIESPLVIKNVCVTDMLCEIRDHDGLSVLWRSLAAQIDPKRDGGVSVPADLAPFVHGKTYRLLAIALPDDSKFSHESEIPLIDPASFTRLRPPKPYSRSSVTKGVVDSIFEGVNSRSFGTQQRRKQLFVNVCGMRIGSFAPELSVKPQGVSFGSRDMKVPEQRMLMIRPLLMVFNHLATAVQVQVRVKERVSQSEESGEALTVAEWSDLGILGCGESASWTEAAPSDQIELRALFEKPDGRNLHEFPWWSSCTTIPAELDSSGGVQGSSSSALFPFVKLQDLRIQDSSKKMLLLSVALTKGTIRSDLAGSCESVHDFARALPPASRVVSLFAPFWVVDSTGLDLQYKSGTFLAGQVDADGSSSSRSNPYSRDTDRTLGLGELLDDSDLIYLPSRRSFQVLMIGNEGSNRLYIRRRQTRLQTLKEMVSPWSDPIVLNADDGSDHDATILPPTSLFVSVDDASQPPDAREAYAVRARLLKAPDVFGGHLGTRIVHVVCRYAVINELGRDLEVAGNDTISTIVHADGRPVPFHFDDSAPIRFRPREFGWIWSGLVYVRRRRREVTLRLRHKLKGHEIFVNVEFHFRQRAGTCVMIFRTAVYPPYRVENRTIHPIQFRQVSNLVDMQGVTRSGTSGVGTIILPYHDAAFAWDEPESRRRAVVVYVADFGDPSDVGTSLIGSFAIDRIVPGTELRLSRRDINAQVVSDGPTRVLRIAETTKSDQGRRRGDYDQQFTGLDVPLSSLTWTVTLKLSHGIGVSLIDWAPQELLYIQLDDLFVEQLNDGRSETGHASIGRIVVNNQLWVTPYPVLLRMGSRPSRRRNRRQSAVFLSWTRMLTIGEGYRNLTLLKNLELLVEPPSVSVDGNLAQFVIDMARRASELRLAGGADSELLPRNIELKRVLQIPETHSESSEPDDPKSLIAEDLYFAFDYMATAAIASKLRSRYRPPSQTATIPRHLGSNDPIRNDIISQRRHKYYIEKLRISSVAAEISWSGALPIASSLPRFLRPALTFEGLPVFLRPFSSSHMYGAADDHLDAVKSHYISIWRIVDLVAGLAAKPTFLIRACIFTTRETFSSTFDLLASGLHALESALVDFVSSDNYVDTTSSQIASAIVTPLIKTNARILRGFATFLETGSLLLQYSASRYRASGAFVRTRNPRLFANVEGKDLLVEYVEGENAGKAMLSRVRTGSFLCEGYVYHIEFAHRPKPGKTTSMDHSPIIVMMTFERLLLLKGELNERFCDVLWEAGFADLVLVESQKPDDRPGFVLVDLWYLNHEGGGTREERQARAIVGEGLDSLHCMQLFVPTVYAPQLFHEIGLVNRRLLEATGR